MLNDNTKDGAPMALSSLPVVGILGRQHSVDGIYHDLSTDLVHIFEGMKFYTYDAMEFKVSFLLLDTKSFDHHSNSVH